ncbi:hypothetical protein LOTGIDRAFT_79308, partial [Lottia gigantea]
NKITFPDIDSDLRTDAQFDEMAQIKHHLATSPFTELNIGMVSQFPLDFMLLVYLSVMKRLLSFW